MATHRLRGLRSAIGTVGFAGILLATLGATPLSTTASRAPTFRAPFLDPCVAGALGDVTNDGVTSLADAQQILRAAVSLPVNATVQSRLLSHGDVTGDGSTSLADAQQILRYSVALAVAFPIGDPMCGIEVTTVTTGADVDPDGYSLELDAASAGAIGLDDMVELTGLDVGSYQVAILGLAANCGVVNGTATRAIDVVEGVAASTTFEVECTTNTVTLRVSNDTEGANQPASYTVTLDGADAKVMNTDSFVEYPNLTPGTYEVTISPVPGNCTITGGNATVEKEVQGTSTLEQVNFAVQCT